MERRKKYIAGAVTINMVAIVLIVISNLKLLLNGNPATMGLPAAAALCGGLALISWGLHRNSNRLLSVGSLLCVLQAFMAMFARFETIVPADAYIMLRALGYLNVFSVSIMRIHAEPAKRASQDAQYREYLVHGYRKTAKRFALQAIAFVLAGELLFFALVPGGPLSVVYLLWNTLLYGVPLFLGVFALSYREWDEIPKE